MARKPRIEYPEAFFHIIVKGNNRQAIFHDEEDSENYLKHLSLHLSESEIALYGFCFMTNRVHPPLAKWIENQNLEDISLLKNLESNSIGT